jgi:Protein of unknown function (DUF2905)
MGRNLGPLTVMAGIVIAALGILVWAGGFSWFGRLPGDIRIESDTCASTSRWSRCFWSRSRPAYCCPSRSTFSGGDDPDIADGWLRNGQSFQP